MPKGFKEFEDYDKACDEVIFEHETSLYKRQNIKVKK